MFKEEPEIKLVPSNQIQVETAVDSRWKHFVRLMETEPKTHEKLLQVMNSKIVKLREKMHHHFNSVGLQEKTPNVVRFTLSEQS
jgi:hypothetical protein